MADPATAVRRCTLRVGAVEGWEPIVIIADRQMQPGEAPVALVGDRHFPLEEVPAATGVAYRFGVPDPWRPVVFHPTLVATLPLRWYRGGGASGNRFAPQFSEVYNKHGAGPHVQIRVAPGTNLDIDGISNAVHLSGPLGAIDINNASCVSIDLRLDNHKDPIVATNVVLMHLWTNGVRPVLCFQVDELHLASTPMELAGTRKADHDSAKPYRIHGSRWLFADLGDSSVQITGGLELGDIAGLRGSKVVVDKVGLLRTWPSYNWGVKVDPPDAFGRVPAPDWRALRHERIGPEVTIKKNVHFLETDMTDVAKVFVNGNIDWAKIGSPHAVVFGPDATISHGIRMPMESSTVRELKAADGRRPVALIDGAQPIAMTGDWRSVVRSADGTFGNSWVPIDWEHAPKEVTEARRKFVLLLDEMSTHLVEEQIAALPSQSQTGFVREPPVPEADVVDLGLIT